MVYVVAEKCAKPVIVAREVTLMKFDRQSLMVYVVFLFMGAAGSMGTLTLFNRVQPATIVITPLAPTAVPEPTATPGPITVFVNGAVNVPGLYALSRGSRVDDAIAAAAGFAPEAAADVVNLAQELQDGSQIYVPLQTEAAGSPPVVSVPVLNVSSGTGGLPEQPQGKVNLNTASKELLETLPGIGPSTAQKIADYRDEVGLFTQIEDIMNVSGIGEGKFDKIKDQITVEDG
jgi:competence protein ComEA